MRLLFASLPSFFIPTIRPPSPASIAYTLYMIYDI